MARAPIELRRIANDPALLDRASQGSAVVGLGGLLAARPLHARESDIPEQGMSGFRWRFRDTRSQRWWPQGIALGSSHGVPFAVVSWYRQPRRGRGAGSRITVIDLRDLRRPNYWHVLLVEPRATSAGAVFEPVVVHAGGIAVAGERLFVAATFGGIREFRLSNILRSPARSRLLGHGHVLPQIAAYSPAAADRGLRFSFLSLETGERELPDVVRLVAGEYDTGQGGRLARIELTERRATAQEELVPGIAGMQGAALHRGTWFVSSSHGTEPGDLWTGTPADFRRVGPLPPGPEDLAVWPERNQLWSLTEWPGKRWVFWRELPRE